jgi:hypothetical protein
MSATHNGTCQTCGNQQAVSYGRVAKHGYTVEWGYFNGQCSGSGELPLEQGRSTADNTHDRLLEASSNALKFIKTAKIDRVTVKVYVGGLQRYGWKTFGKAEYIEYRKQFSVTTTQGTAAWKEAQASERNRLQRYSDSCKQAAAELSDRIAARYRKPLYPRESEQTAARTRKHFSSKREAYAFQAELEARGIKARVNGGSWKRPEIFVTYSEK